MAFLILLVLVVLVFLFPWLLPVGLGLFLFYIYFIYRRAFIAQNQAQKQRNHETRQSSDADGTSKHGQVKGDVIDAEYKVTEVEEDQ